MEVIGDNTLQNERNNEENDAKDLHSILLGISRRRAEDRRSHDLCHPPSVFHRSSPTVSSSISKTKSTFSSVVEPLSIPSLVTSSSTTPPPSFLRSNPEDPNLNQYWYSSDTITVLRAAILEGLASIQRYPYSSSDVTMEKDGGGGRVAFLSTPSLYFSFPESVRRKWKFNLFEVSE